MPTKLKTNLIIYYKKTILLPLIGTGWINIGLACLVDPYRHASPSLEVTQSSRLVVASPETPGALHTTHIEPGDTIITGIVAILAGDNNCVVGHGHQKI